MKVLLTRRLADSERTAEKLKAAGFQPVILPLFELESTGQPCPDIKPDFIMFTSAAAVEHADWGRVEDAYKSLPCYSVGPKTTSLLHSRGYTNIRQGDGTAAELATLIESENAGHTMHGLYVCGETRAYDFAKRFEGHGISLSLWEAYRVKQADIPENRLVETINTVKGGIILLFSPKGVDRFLEIFDKIDAKNELLTCHFVAISANCAARLPQFLQKNVLIADTPDEARMIAAATRLTKTKP